MAAHRRADPSRARRRGDRAAARRRRLRVEPGRDKRRPGRPGSAGPPQPTVLAASGKCVVSYAVCPTTGGRFNATVTVANRDNTAIKNWNLWFIMQGDQVVKGDGKVDLDQQGTDRHGQLGDAVLSPQKAVDHADQRPVRQEQRGTDGVPARWPELRDVRVRQARPAVPAGRSGCRTVRSGSVRRSPHPMPGDLDRSGVGWSCRCQSDRARRPQTDDQRSRRPLRRRPSRTAKPTPDGLRTAHSSGPRRHADAVTDDRADHAARRPTTDAAAGPERTRRPGHRRRRSSARPPAPHRRSAREQTSLIGRPIGNCPIGRPISALGWQ